MSVFELQVQKGKRFEFGKNWQSYLSTLSEEEIKVAEESIKNMLQVENLREKTFLDIGSGSGLFSLAARNLGARVYSFDFDPNSVSCTKQLRSSYYPSDPQWIVEEGSILDEDYIHSIEKTFDIVYSWGVLHHTGNMWKALDNAASLVKEDGILCVAIYNSLGIKSRFWRKIKRYYCSGSIGKVTTSSIFIPYFFTRTLISCLVRRKNIFSVYKQNRGMSITHDWIDWLGGFPYETAKVEDIFHYFRERNFELKNIKTTNSSGNNQFVFIKRSDK